MGPLRIFTFDDEDTPDVSTGYVSATGPDDYAGEITDTLNGNQGCWVMSSLKGKKSGLQIPYSIEGEDNIVAKYTPSGILYITFNFAPDKAYQGCSKIYLNDLYDIVPEDKLRKIVIRYENTPVRPFIFSFVCIDGLGQTKDKFLELVRFDCDIETMPKYIEFNGRSFEQWVIDDNDNTYYKKNQPRSKFPIKFWKGGRG